MLVAVTHLADFLVVGAFGLSSSTVTALRDSSRASATWPISRTGDSLGDRYEEAFVNALAAHALDWDDVMLGVPNHPGTVIWPALLATAKPSTTIRELAEGFLEGVGMAAELGSALGVEHYRRGWHATATIGRMAAAYAAATLYRDNAVAWSAMQLAAIGCSGVSDVFGTSVKPAQVGMAAAGAAQAVHLVESIDDVPDVLLPETKLGRILGVRQAPQRRARYASPAATQALRVKSYPMCYFAHAPVDAARQFGAKGFSAPQNITVTVSPNAARICDVITPRTINEARFSLPYLVAAAGMTWADGALGLVDSAILSSQRVAATAEKVTVEVNSEFNDMKATVVIDGLKAHVDLEVDGSGTSRRLVAEKARHESVRRLLPSLLIDFIESDGEPSNSVLETPVSSLFAPLAPPQK